MKNKRIYILYFLSAISIFPQNITAQIVKVVENLNLSNGYYVYCTPGVLESPSYSSNPVNLTGTSQVTYIAGNEIQLLDGFSSHPTNNGYFHGYTNTSEYDVTMEPLNASVPEFEKVEFSIKVPDIIQTYINNFVNHQTGTGLNPFNPDDISVEATFTNPSTSTTKVYGFYSKDYIYDGDPSDDATRWTELHNDYNFKVRFSPNEIGRWKCSIAIKYAPTSSIPTYTFCDIDFDCISNPISKGIIVTGNNGYLKYSKTNETFFPIGAYLGWANRRWDDYDPYTANPKTLRPVEYDDYMLALENIKNSGGNYVRVMVTSLSWGIEWEEIGNYYKRMPQAWELDRVIEYCEQNGLYVSLQLTHSGDFLDIDINNTNESCFDCWDEHPYKTFLKNPPYNYPEPVDPTLFITHPAAVNQYKKFVRYMISRWSYSSHIAKIEIANEGNQIGHSFQDGHNNGMSVDYNPYYQQFNASFNIPSSYQYQPNNSWISPNTNQYYGYDLGQWIKDIAGYIKIDLGAKQLITWSNAGYAAFGDDSFYSPFISTLSVHHAADNMDVNLQRASIVHSYKSIYGNKPFIFEEIYPASGNFHFSLTPSSYDGPVFQNDTELHNALWSMCFTNAAGSTPLYFPVASDNALMDPTRWIQAHGDTAGLWVYEHLLSYKKNNQFFSENIPALSAFMNDVDFENFNYNSVTDPGILQLCMNMPQLEKFILNGDKQAMGWIHLRRWYWATADNSSTDCQITYAPYTYSPTNGCWPGDPFQGATPPPIINQILQLQLDQSYSSYTINWYDTREPNHILATETTPRLQMPGYNVEFTIPDLGAPITDANDPLYCPRCIPDIAFKIYPTSEGSFKSLHTSSPANLNIIPNPNNGEFTLSLQSSFAGNPNFYIIDLSGRILHTQSISLQEGLNQIQMSKPELPAGIYFIKVDGIDETIKMIIAK